MAKNNSRTVEQDELPVKEQDMSRGPGMMSDSVGEYLREIGRYELLTAEEEKQLSDQIRAGQDAARLLEQQEDCGEAADEERQALLRRQVSRGEEAKNRMVRANLRLVVMVAKKYLNRGLPLQDLIQEGNIGLMKAASDYNGQRGTRFSTYAAWWIRQSISRAVADCGRTIRLPSHIFHQVLAMRKAAGELTLELDRQPTEKELAERLGINVAKLKALRRYERDASSLDVPLDSDGGTVIDVIPGDNPVEQVDEELTRKALALAVRKVLDTLPQRERMVLSLRYGLADGRVHTLDEVGRRVGLTRERVRQIERKTLRLLRTDECAAQLKVFTA